MGLRERIEREMRAALRSTGKGHAVRINRSTKVNAVVVRNIGGGAAAASAEQTAPIVQGPSEGDGGHPDEA